MYLFKFEKKMRAINCYSYYAQERSDLWPPISSLTFNWRFLFAGNSTHKVKSFTFDKLKCYFYCLYYSLPPALYQFDTTANRLEKPDLLLVYPSGNLNAARTCCLSSSHLSGA